MNILFEDFNAKLWRVYIQTDNWNESLHQDSNDNGVRIVNFCQTKKNFPHRNTDKYKWTSDGKNHNQNDHI